MRAWQLLGYYWILAVLKLTRTCLPIMTLVSPAEPCRLSLVNCVNLVVMLDFRVQLKEIRCSSLRWRCITLSLLCNLSNKRLFSVTNGKHQWVPKEIAEAAEKYAKVSWGKHVELGVLTPLVMKFLGCYEIVSSWEHPLFSALVTDTLLSC